MIIFGKLIKIEGRLVRIARPDTDKHQSLDDPAAIVSELPKCGERIDLFTFIQRPPDSAPLYNYPMELDNLAVIPISTFDSWWNQQIGFKARNKAKQAEKKGIVLRETPFDDTLARGIYEIYHECPVRQGRPFPHYHKDFETILHEAATYLESSVFIGAYSGEQLVGFAKLICDESRVQAGLVHIVSMIKHRDKAPTNALVAHAVRACADRGISYLAYSNFTYGNKVGDSLAEFKERNGFQKMILPRYYVPLTKLGSLAYKLRLHHKLVDRIPQSMVVKLRELRNQWYNRKLKATPAAN